MDAATGEVLDQRSRYAHAGPEGDVFREQHPEATGAARQMTPFTGINGSWVADRTTSGNNVNAYLDRNDDDANNEYQPQTPASGDPGYQEFDYALTDAWRTTADVNSVAALDADRDAIITQLFYYTNVMHDWLYAHGFDEASGNFQVDNFGTGERRRPRARRGPGRLGLRLHRRQGTVTRPTRSRSGASTTPTSARPATARARACRCTCGAGPALPRRRHGR